jgi:hypothetical protein
MVYVSRAEGGYGTGASVIQNDSAHNSVLVTDAELLVSGAYHRAGPDLVLTSPDGRHFIVPGYFSSEHPPALVAPNGMTLSGDMVELLAGSPTPGQYAQAQPGLPTDGIGKIEKAVGDVTAIRNGVAVTLHVGDAVYKSDVIQTGTGSSVGISFPDGTALNLVANTRMGLNDYNYNPSSNSNDALFTLVEGTFAFVAGKVAHTGDMKIGTPVATMGIRGTTGVVEEEVATVNATQNGVSYSFSVVADFGTGVAGLFDLIDANGNVVATVSQTGYVTYLTPQGVGQPPAVSVAPVSNAQFAVEQDILQQLFQALTPVQQQQQSTPGNSTPPAPPPNPIIQLLQNGNTTTTVASASGAPTNNPPPPTTVTVVITPPPATTPTATPIVFWTATGPGNWDVAGNWSDDVVPTSVSAIEILTASTIFVTDSETANGVDLGPGATLEIGPGGFLTVSNLIAGPGTLELNADGADPTLAINGAVSLATGVPGSNGTLLLTGTPSADDHIVGVAGSGAVLTNVDFIITGAGQIGAGDGNLTLINETGGVINATGLLVIDTGNEVTNAGLMEATAGGTLQIEDGVSNAGMISTDTAGTLQIENVTVTNSDSGEVSIAANSTLDLDAASILGGTVLNAGNISVTGSSEIQGDTVTNTGDITVGENASLTLEGTASFSNAMGAEIEANGGAITINLDVSADVNDGTIEALSGGSVTININEDGSSNHGLIEAVGDGSSVTFSRNNQDQAAQDGDGGSDSDSGGNYGTIEATGGGVVTFNSGLDNYDILEAAAGGTADFTDDNHNHSGGTIESTGADSLVDFSDGSLDNFSTVIAENGGAISLGSVMLTNETGATFEVSGSGSSISYTTGGVTNDGTIEADNSGAITFGGSIGIQNEGGTIEALSGGTILFETDGTGSVSNDGGTIEASGAGSSVTFDSSLNGAQNDDGGVIEALNGGIVTIDGFEGGNGLANSDGLIEASGAGSKVELAGATVMDGTLETGSGGIIENVSGTSTLNGVAIAGGSLVQSDNGTVIDLTGATTLSGGTVTFRGDGVFEFGGNGASIVGPSQGSATLVNHSTIEGAGTIGNGDGGAVLSLNNSGTIEAAGGTLVINTGTRNQSTTINTGTLEASGTSAMLEISFTNLLNTAGIIAAFNAAAALSAQASTPSQVDLLGATITNGTLETTNQGTIETITDNGAASTSTFINVTNEAYVYVTGDTTLVLSDTITNTGGTIALDTGGAATLEISGVTSINGGAVELNGGSDSIVAVQSNAMLSNAAMIEGAGDIGSGSSSLTLTNQSSGTIDANISGEQLTINTGSNTVTNLGLMEATNGGKLVIDSNLSNSSITSTVSASGGTVTFNDVTITNAGQIGASTPLGGTAGTVQIDSSTINNAGGTISAVGSGDLVQLSGSTINGGTLATSEGGAIEFVGTNNVLNGGGTAGNSSISVPAYASSTEWHDSGIHVTAGEQITITASGTVSIGDNVIEGGQNVSSEFPAGDPNLVTGDIANPDNFLENGLVPWSLVGIIGGSSPAANAANAFQVDNGTTFTVAATGELYLSINDNVFTDNSGNWSATVSLSSPDTVTNSGFTQLESGASLTLEGVIDNTGTIDVDTVTNNPNATNLVISGGVVLEGSGSVSLDGSTDSIIGVTGGGILDNAGNTISGSGNIGLNGNGLLSLVNYGTVEATTGNLVIDTGHTVVNNGTLEANGATLVVDDAVSGSGQVLVTNGGTADFAAALGENATFSGAGTLGLADPTAFNGEITGLNTGDTIDLSNIALSDISSATIDGAHLVVDETGGQTLTFNITGNLTGNQFAASSDGHGGTDLTLTPNELVVNGGFETGNLNGWTGNGVQLQYDYIDTQHAHSGSYDLALGAINAEYQVYQNIATTAGQTYQVQFWLENPYGGTPSNLTASFGGDTLLSLSNTNAQGYTEYTYDVTATSSSSQLLFVAEQNPAYWYLDDVSVQHVNAPVGDPPITPGATLTVSGASNEVYDFTGATGTLVLDQPQNFTGQIEGFTGTAPNAAHSDVVDLAGINYDSGHFSESYNTSTGVLTVSDGTDNASLTFDNFNATFEFASDGNGGTDIFDPPAAGSNAQPAPTGHGMNFGKDQINLSENNAPAQNGQTSSTAPGGNQSGSVSIGGKANDHFVFQQANFTETNLNTNQPSTPLSEHAGDHNTQLAALVSHDAVFQLAFDPVHDDAATAQFHQIVASAGHLH